MLERLPELGRVLEALGDPRGLHVVGGTVRDLLLDNPGTDLDLVREGPVEELAAELADRLGGRAVLHGRFGTAVVRYGDAKHVDLIQARRETYAEPAALPVVEPGTIEDDLARRDFTINAMAAPLPDGDVLDPFEGRGDLEGKTIRVLHERSFVDDPTRIFRAIRYESRLGFRINPQTEALAGDAIDGGFVGRLSGPRVREELIALLGEDEAPASILRMAELRLDRAVDPPLRAGLNAVKRLQRVRELVREHDVDAPAWRLALETLVEPGQSVEALALTGRDRRLVEGAATDARELAERVADLDSAELAELAGRHAPDAPLLALAISGEPRLHDWFERLRHVRLEVTGDDLAGLGVPEGPRVGEILAELRRRKLNGELEGRETELAAARALAADD
jgi:tRNA nucleotidyltransferase (CCA-adding enzyme)